MKAQKFLLIKLLHRQMSIVHLMEEIEYEELEKPQFENREKSKLIDFFNVFFENFNSKNIIQEIRVDCPFQT